MTDDDNDDLLLLPQVTIVEESEHIAAGQVDVDEQAVEIEQCALAGRVALLLVVG